MKVLVVDDDSMVRFLLHSHISRAFPGCKVKFAMNGADAVDKVEEFRPDVMFLDIKMPVMDGISALRRIKQLSPETNVIMCSSEEDEASINNSLLLGACDYIPKPFSKDRVLTTLLKYL